MRKEVSDLIDRKALIEALEPFLKSVCSEYIKDMILAKVRYMPAVLNVDELKMEVARYEKMGKMFESKDYDRHDPIQACMFYENAALLKSLIRQIEGKNAR